MDTQYFADPQLAELHGEGAALAKSALWDADLTRPFSADQLRHLYASLAPAGYLGGLVPADQGGAGMSREEFAALLEGISEVAPYLSNHSAQREIAACGTPAARDRWLPGLLAGRTIGTIAMTEPQGGSDLSVLRTTLERDGAGFRLTGQKVWAVHTMTADVAIVLARGVDGRPTRVVVDLEHNSIRREAIGTSGLRYLSFGLLDFRGTPVHADDILADEDDAATEFMLATERALVAVQASSIGQRAVYAAIKHLATRSVRGRKVTERDVVRREIGELSAAVEAARVFGYHALRFIDAQQRGVGALAAAAKSHATGVCTTVTNRAIELCAAEGLVADGEGQRLRDDALMLATAHGTSMVNAIAWGEYVVEQSQLRR